MVDTDVKTIGEQAFHAQSQMTSIKLPENLEKINNSFQFCRGLTTIEIPSSVEIIASVAFSNASNLTRIVVKKVENSIAGAPWGSQYGDKAVYWKPEE